MRLLKRVIWRWRLRDRKRTVGLGFERFEDRCLLSTFVVNNTGGTGLGSLRQAILDSNANTGTTNTIQFDIPTTDSGYDSATGTWKSQLSSPLPSITASVTIDGTSQPGNKPITGAPLIEIEGTSLLGDGLILGPTSGGSTITGLDIGGFSGGAAVRIESNNDVISGNFIGPNSVGAKVGLGNLFGIIIDNVADNTIGGTTAADANVIGFSNSNALSAAGLEMVGSMAIRNVVEGNLIGISASGANLGNNFGIYINDGANNTIGGTVAGTANTIGFNVAGVNIDGTAATGHNAVEGNFIGTNSVGSKLGNGYGIAIAGSNNTIGGTVAGAGNTIADNTVDAVHVFTGSGNAIRQNLIFGNHGSIVVESGANNNQAVPQDVAVASVPGQTTIDYTVMGTAAGTYSVEFFASSNLGSPAAVFLGTAEVTLAAAGSQSSTQVLMIGTGLLNTQTVTATVTGPDNSTSEFAASVTPRTPTSSPISAFVVTNTSDNVPGSFVGSLRQVILNANQSPPTSGTDDITFAIPVTGPFTITPTAVLPTISVPVTIDGTNEAGVVINGGGQSFDGLTLATGSGGSTIKGLDIVDFATGIAISSSNNTIGGASSTANTIGFNIQAGVAVLSGSGNAIRADQFIGTNGVSVPDDDIKLSGGANNDQPAPILLNSIAAVGQLFVTFTENVPSGTSVALDVYQANSTSSPIQRIFLGTQTVTVGSGASSVVIAAPGVTPGDTIVATATVTANGTSAFSTESTVTNPLVVTNTEDAGTGSLRLAMMTASTNPGSVITFAIPGSAPFMIMPSSVLPTIAVPVAILGTTEPGVQIDGRGQPFVGLTLGAGADGSTITGLDIADFAGAGINIQSNQDTIADNQIGTNQTGILINGSNNTIGGTIAGAGNTIADNTDDAVDVASGFGNAIRQDLIFGNGSAISLVGGANNNQAPPQVVAVASVPNLTTIDYAVTGTAAGTYTVEFFASSSMGSPAAQFLGTAEVTLATAGSRSFTQVLSIGTRLLDSQTVSATVTGPENSTSEFAASVKPRTPTSSPISAFDVTNTSDNVPGSEVGSLRQVILDANQSPPSSGTDNISFAIPGSSPFAISPTSALPMIIQTVFIDGTTQPGYTLTPLIEIEGTSLLDDGLILGPNSDGSTITGLDIGGFSAGAAVQIESNNNVISGNFIGTNSAGDKLANGSGIAIAGSNNTIGGTVAGAGNTIADNTVDAVHVFTGSGNAIRQNLIFGNHGSIVVESGANNNQAVPQVVAVASVPGQTTIDYTVMGTAAGTYSVEFFASSNLGSPAAVFLGTAEVNLAAAGSQSSTQVLMIGTGLLNTQTVTATVTGPDNSTSEFAASVMPRTPTSSPISAFVVTNTSDNVPGSFVGSLRQVILDANQSPPTSGSDPITFAIPGSSPFTIKPTTMLPAVTVPVTIDGTNEAGVVINGGGQSFDGLTLATGSGGSTIKGLDIVDFATGIAISSSNNTIGGASSQANTIGFNSRAGVAVLSGTGNAIREDQYIGTNGVSAPADDITLSAGANNNQPAPILLNTIAAVDQLFVTFTDNVPSGTSVTLDVYQVISGSSPIQRVFLDTKTVTVGAGAASVVIAAPGITTGDTIAATATVTANGTSAFSAESTAANPTNPLVVTNTNDSGTGSLRQAMIFASTNSGSVITFAIPGSSPFVIIPSSVLPTIAVKVTIDGTTESTFLGQPAVVQVNGRGQEFDGLTLGAGSDGSTITGLDIADFAGAGINVRSNHDTITDNRIGTDPTGSAAGPGNQTGIAISGSNNTIGGTEPGAGNLISGNSGNGISLTADSANNLVLGNLIGTNFSGEAALANAAGISLSASSGNTIGGIAPVAANIISGNASIGIEIDNSTRNVVQGNSLGPARDGINLLNAPDVTTGFPIGVHIDDSPANTIGGSVTGAGNVISGFGVGVYISGSSESPSSGNLIQGNSIGTDATGKVVSNAIGTGVYINGAADNTVGGATAAASNVIVGYSRFGIYIFGPSATGNVVRGNQIVQASQVSPAATEELAGIAIADASHNTVGGLTTADGNTISGKHQAGVYILGHRNSASKNLIAQNRLQGNHFGIVLFNAKNNGVPSQLRKQNQFTRNGIAVRVVTGPVPPSGNSSASASTHNAERVHHAQRAKPRPDAVHIHRMVVHRALRLANGSGMRADQREPRHFHELAFSNARLPASAVRAQAVLRTVVPHGPRAHLTPARLSTRP
jgi:hypothetical protein